MSPLLVDARNGNDPRDQALNGFVPEARSRNKGKTIAGSSSPRRASKKLLRRGGCASSDMSNAGSAVTLTKVFQAVTQATIFRVVWGLSGVLGKPR